METPTNTRYAGPNGACLTGALVTGDPNREVRALGQAVNQAGASEDIEAVRRIARTCGCFQLYALCNGLENPVEVDTALVVVRD